MRTAIFTTVDDARKSHAMQARKRCVFRNGKLVSKHQVPQEAELIRRYHSVQRAIDDMGAYVQARAPHSVALEGEWRRGNGYKFVVTGHSTDINVVQLLKSLRFFRKILEIPDAIGREEMIDLLGDFADKYEAYFQGHMAEWLEDHAEGS